LKWKEVIKVWELARLAQATKRDQMGRLVIRTRDISDLSSEEVQVIDPSYCNP